MPSFHINISTGPKGAAFEHAQYIAREGRFADEEKYGPVIAQGQANFPEWAREDRNAFWSASDEFERANGNTYREYELALPRELSREQQIALVERFAEQELGSTRVYQWAIHEPNASDGKPQPHVHLMFSDRQLDGIERGPEKFFKRYNSKNPERGGAQKFSYGEDKAEAARTYEGIRERWAKVQNLALEHAGIEARVDHRSLAAQGIFDRAPGLHRGPAVSGIEARGEVSEVGRRQREQRLERSLERQAVVAEVRVVTREEMALERVAVRERRELAQEATGEDREIVLKRVEVDRREQLGRAQAMAERRVERRQQLGFGDLKEKLLTQARALRERIAQQLERVKEWVAERYPDPLGRLKELSQDLVHGLTGKRPMARTQQPQVRSQKTRTMRQEHEVKSSAAELSPTPKLSLEQIQAEGRRQGLQERERQTKDPAPSLEEIRRQGREDWLKLRAETATPAQAPRREVAVEKATTAELSATPEPDAATVQRERLSRLTSAELQELIRRINPPAVSQLTALEPAVQARRAEVENYRHTAHQALLRANQAAAEINTWRHAHGMQAKLHDLGVAKSAYLAEREAAARDAERVHREVSAAIGPALAESTQAWAEASQRLTQATAPAREQVAELRQFLAVAYERERLVTEFEQLAKGRAAGRREYQDTSQEWQTLAPKLRRAIDRYNGEQPQVQAALLEKFSRTPVLEKSLGAELTQHREQVRDLDQGLSL